MNKKSDFFNLNSDEEDEEEEVDLKTKKWDWDKEENRDLYYPKPTIFTSNLKRLLLASDYEDQYEDVEKFKKIKNYSENEGKNNFFIEKLKNESVEESERAKLEYKLVGHTNSVNRVFWGKHGENKNRLLSSSMDGYFKKETFFYHTINLTK